MNEIELLENLYETAQKISYKNKGQFDVLEKRTEMIIRKIFGDESHYLSDLKRIRYRPSVIISSVPTDWKGYFESGLKQFQNIIQVMIEDKKLSSNYESKEASKFIKTEKISQPSEKTLKEIKVIIASPSDVLRERELLLDKLETKFRRDHYEERCGTRIVVEGWEYMPSQPGYAQDIINSDLLKNANVIIAIFRHQLGSPTIDIKTGKDRSQSGTAEELLFAIRNRKIENPPLGMVYFYANAPDVSLDAIDIKKINKEWKRLKEFKEEIKNEILYKTYQYEEEILEIVCKDLYENILKYFK